MLDTFEDGVARKAFDGPACLPFLDHFTGNVGNAVAEAVDVHHPSLYALIIHNRKGPFHRGELVYGAAEALYGYSVRKVGRRRRKDVAPVESFGRGGAAPVLGPVEAHADIGRRPVEDQRENAVIRSCEEVFAATKCYGAPIRSDARIHHGHVYGADGKIPCSVAQHEGAFHDVLWCDRMRDIHDTRIGAQAKDNAFYSPDIRILCPEVCRKGYDCGHGDDLYNGMIQSTKKECSRHATPRRRRRIMDIDPVAERVARDVRYALFTDWRS